MISKGDAFANLSVQSKLVIGFSLVMSIGLSVTSTGFYSAHTLSGLLDRSLRLGELKNNVLSLSAAGDRYQFLKDLDSGRLQTEAVQRMENSLAESKSYLTDAQEIELRQLIAKFRESKEGGGSDNHDNIGRADQAKLGVSLKRQDRVDNALVGLVDSLLEDVIAERSRQVSYVYVLLCLMSLLATAGSAFAVWLISRSLVPPLKSTVDIAERIASGNLMDVEDSSRQDEIGRLLRSIRKMASGLRTLVGSIGQGAKQLSSASAKLSLDSAEAQISFEQQRVEVSQVLMSINELVATVQEIVRNTEMAADAAVETGRKAQDGELIVNGTVDQIEYLAIDMESLGSAMDNLQQGSEKIGQVVDVIKAVAEQTNLLALNAAIEAARAGDQGRGFAVVADEVRALAIRTRQSTEEIEQLISFLQAGAIQASKLMNQSSQRTAEAVGLAQKTKSALSEISQAVSDIQAMNQKIAASAEQQGVAVKEINQNIVSVSEKAGQSASRSAHALNSIEELGRLGRDLDSAVHRFNW
ncbi:methyl-accepting chemotaxis protein [Pseudomonas sp. N-137]|uniref:methyl-accepting chemotaxis protein n=1 Tax=Pseudomonas sp. N-137 TaxID=3108452 RepID=UPI002ADEFC08|nr:methyl-accepting chemotaxis protein [Pseudomonas sp. N-137]MEA1028058.1 methyl-accepting chemotaxis protein [Pseudomonas sp. N-137]